MAQAVLDLFPNAKLAIGPPIEDGFYYDFDLGKDADGKPISFNPEDLTEIERRMKELVACDEEFVEKKLSPADARELFMDQPYKLELIHDILQGGETSSDAKQVQAHLLGTYRNGGFVDLCRGPHLRSTGEIPLDGFKLLSIAGAYWRGDERRQMLQRIYGTAWSTAEQLQTYLIRREKLVESDHRRLNRDLQLYISPDEIGAGLIIYGPEASRLRSIVEEYWRNKHFECGYEMLYSPHIGHAKLWETSGHLEFYRDKMYSPLDIEGQQYFLKPMNCPFHMLYYKSQVRSYRDLPIRLAELGTVYRYERSGVLHGLLRTRGFTQDDAHIICTPEQITCEIEDVLKFSLEVWDSFGFADYEIRLATRPDKAIGTDEKWAEATDALRRVLEAREMPYEIDERGGSFYGPKIDLDVKDLLGRAWQLTTIQFDFNLPERFDMVYTASDGSRKRPYMVHRALLGSWERFFGLLIEHYAGAFPVWLSSTQALVIPIAERHSHFAARAGSILQSAGLRVEIDTAESSLQARIRRAHVRKIPYIVIVGDREEEHETLSVRLRNEEDLGEMTIQDLIDRVTRTVKGKKGL